MLDPDWVLTRPILWLALAGLVALLVVRTIRKDRKEYQRFKRYRLTARRQAMYRKWLRDSALTFGGLSIALLLLAAQFVAPLLAEVRAWPGVRDIRVWIGEWPGVAAGVVLGLVLGFVGLTVAALVSARRSDPIPTVGDIGALLPRNKQELRLGAILAINAGIVEELMFRLALPAVVFGATGSAVAAVVGSLLLFGGLHLYQGIAGVVGTTIVGTIMMLLYVISGTIIVPIVLHALFDLRSLVLIPMAMRQVHRIDGDARPAANAGPSAGPGPAPAAEAPGVGTDER